MRGDGPVPEHPALSFGELLRRLRDDAGLTQEELAEAASLSPRSVSDLERGVTSPLGMRRPGCWRVRSA